MRSPRNSGLHRKKTCEFPRMLRRRPKKSLHPTIHANFHEFWGEAQKQTVLVAKSTKKQFLLTNYEVRSSILRVSGLELHSSSTKPVNFFGAQSLLGGSQFLFGGHGPGMPPRGDGTGCIKIIGSKISKIPFTLLQVDICSPMAVCGLFVPQAGLARRQQSNFLFYCLPVVMSDDSSTNSPNLLR